MKEKPKSIIYSRSFDPPGYHDVITVQALMDFATENDELWIIPYGGRPGKKGLSTPFDRRQMIYCAFHNTSLGPRTIVDFMDLGRNKLTPNIDMDEHFRCQRPERAVWHVIGANMITGGACGESRIHRKWKDGVTAFESLHFIVLITPGVPYDPADLPPHHIKLVIDVQGTSQDIRSRVARGKAIDHLVPPNVLSYIEANNLYCSKPAEK